LRTWRDRVSPAEAGLSPGPRRGGPGRRRQAAAEVAGRSVEYLARLEQGRAGQRSDAVRASLARVLRLSDQERAHLFRLAGQAEPLSGQIKRHVTPSVQRILDRLTDTPVTVVDASWQCVLSNAMGYALTGDTTQLPHREQNLAWTTFMNTPTRYVRTDEEERLLRLEVVADLREAWVRYPQDAMLRELIADLRSVSPPSSRCGSSASLRSRRRSPGPSCIRTSGRSPSSATSSRSGTATCACWSTPRRPAARPRAGWTCSRRSDSSSSPETRGRPGHRPWPLACAGIWCHR